MARENQGLQIALIIFVMLTVVLGVTTFAFSRKSDDAAVKAQEVEAAAITARSADAQTAAECKELKRMMGFAPTKPLQEIASQFDKDMAACGHWPEDIRFYSPILQQLVGTIHVKDDTIAGKDKVIQRQKDEYARRERERDERVAQFEKAAKESGERLKKAMGENENIRREMIKEQQEVPARIERIRTTDRAEIRRLQEQLDRADAKIGELAETNRKLVDEINKLRRPWPDRFLGEIVTVDRQQGAVSINLGSADGLAPQITFSVYSGDTVDLAKAKKKAIIEVTELNGEHQAMARVLEDSNTDPIVPGDKIFTPLWSPGQQKHFALAGYLDLGGNGKNDLEGVKRLIGISHGVVDFEVDDQGRTQGKMSTATTYLILGDRPAQNAPPAAMKAYTDASNEAKQLGIRTISLADLKEQMGYRSPAEAKH